MAKKDLRAQMDAARAAAAFIGAAQEELSTPLTADAPEEAERTVVERAAVERATVESNEPKPAKAKPARTRQVKSAASDVTLPASTPDFFVEDYDEPAAPAVAAEEPVAAAKPVSAPADKPKPARARKPRKKAAEVEPELEADASGARMTAQVLVPMTAEQREHADLLASVMKITRAEVMRQALDEYWESHKSELQAAVAAYEALIKKLMK